MSALVLCTPCTPHRPSTQLLPPNPPSVCPPPASPHCAPSQAQNTWDTGRLPLDDVIKSQALRSGIIPDCQGRPCHHQPPCGREVECEGQRDLKRLQPAWKVRRVARSQEIQAPLEAGKARQPLSSTASGFEPSEPAELQD